MNQLKAYSIFTAYCATLADPKTEGPDNLAISTRTYNATRRKMRPVTKPILRRIYRIYPPLRIAVRRVLHETPETIRGHLQ